MSNPDRSTAAQTHRLAEAGEILQTLGPRPLAALYLFSMEEEILQEEIAGRLDCARSTISKYVQSLSDLSVPFVEKRGRKYTVTEAGDYILGRIDGMADRLGVEIELPEWSNKQESQLDRMLTPLHDSRSVSPFFVLHSVSKRGGGSALLESPETVLLDDIIDDVQLHQRARGESITTQQVRQVVNRFVEAEAMNFDGARVRLTKKGKEQARLLKEVTELLKEHHIQSEETTGVRHREDIWAEDEKWFEDVAEEKSTIAQRPVALPSTATPAEEIVVNQADTQLSIRSFTGGDTSLSTTHGTPTIVPALCVAHQGESETCEDDANEFELVLPITSMTIGDLQDHLDDLAGRYDDKTDFVPYWVLQTAGATYPLGQLRLPLNEASHRAWNIINQAYRVWATHADNKEQRES